ncbi:MAG: tetratricopeptide repeat protein [Deltaproteobacteria bacterium]|nr:tetratricopeptide repeat protein [Deltaproteobacteria bacterium]
MDSASVERGLVSLGRSYLQAGDAKAALATFRYAQQKLGNRPAMDRWLGAAAQQCEEDDEAIAAYERALVTAPDDLEVTVNLAELYLNRLVIDRAAKLLEKALALDPKIAHPAGMRARILIMKAKKQAGT